VPNSNLNPKIDAYLSKCETFAQPILAHIRGLVHTACPEVAEEIKWSHPFFLHKGKILANMAGFKAHCSLGFWGAEVAAGLREEGILQEGGMGSLGKIASLADLPPDKILLRHLRQAVALVDSGRGENKFTMARRTAPRAAKPAIEIPTEFTAALAKDRKAAATFAAFSPSCQREYTEWIASAKQAATRDRRIAQATEWIAEGKQRNWKYQNC
jgi:uncharacterized protein YdeI (YjbR/CyaY-like superfamily)